MDGDGSSSALLDDDDASAIIISAAVIMGKHRDRDRGKMMMMEASYCS